jgi:hypothetical protein
MLGAEPCRSLPSSRSRALACALRQTTAGQAELPLLLERQARLVAVSKTEAFGEILAYRVTWG